MVNQYEHFDLIQHHSPHHTYCLTLEAFSSSHDLFSESLGTFLDTADWVGRISALASTSQNTEGPLRNLSESQERGATTWLLRLSWGERLCSLRQGSGWGIILSLSLAISSRKTAWFSTIFMFICPIIFLSLSNSLSSSISTSLFSSFSSSILFAICSMVMRLRSSFRSFFRNCLSLSLSSLSSSLASMSLSPCAATGTYAIWEGARGSSLTTDTTCLISGLTVDSSDSSTDCRRGRGYQGSSLEREEARLASHFLRLSSSACLLNRSKISKSDSWELRLLVTCRASWLRSTPYWQGRSGFLRVWVSLRGSLRMRRWLNSGLSMNM